MKIIPLLPLALAMCVGCQVTQTYNSNMPSKGKPTESTAKDVEELINFYNEAFIAKEYSKIVGITEVPFVLVNNDETLSLSTKEELIDKYKNVREPLDDVGYTHSKITSLEITKVNDSISTARIGYARYNKSGDVFHNGEGIYLFRKKENKWFLVGRIESSKTEPLE